MNRRTLIWVCVAGALASGCDSNDNPKPERSAQRASGLTTAAVTLDWQTLTLRAPGYEQVGEGPSSLSVLPGGDLLLLDRLGGRLLRIRRDGSHATFAKVPTDAEDVASNRSGDVAVFSAVRSLSWFFDANGREAGRVSVPRRFRELMGIQLGPSRMLVVRTGYQELYDVGSPSAPIEPTVALETKREGAATVQTRKGRFGVATKVAGGRGELLLIARATSGKRAETVARHPLAGAVSAARIVGTSHGISCVRLEKASQVGHGPIDVGRRLQCLDSGSGATVFAQALPPVGVYLPRREVVFAHGVIAHIEPRPEGLRIQRWELAR